MGKLFGTSIVGRTVNEDVYDFYETPKQATEKALQAMIADGILYKCDRVLEPCCGAGAIVDVLSAYGFKNVSASDIQHNDIIKGERGSGCICLNGAAARKVQVGDTVIIISYAMMDFEEAKTFNPTVVFPKEGNTL